jgi:hypothetical protein
MQRTPSRTAEASRIVFFFQSLGVGESGATGARVMICFRAPYKS